MTRRGFLQGCLAPTSLLRVRAGRTTSSSDYNPVSSYQSSSSNWPTTYREAPQSDGSLSPHVRQHLLRVYNLLMMGVLSCGAASAMMFLTPLGHIIPWPLALFGGFIPLLWLMFKPPATVEGRVALFFAFTILEGMSLAPIVAMSFHGGYLVTAVVLTGAVFGGFSAAAYLAPRASMLALQGPLFGALIGMCAIGVLNIFYPMAIAHSLILYGGLAIFSLFVAVDTQAMIERAQCGVTDHVQDALNLFLNVINIFIRIAEILRGMSE